MNKSILYLLTLFSVIGSHNVLVLFPHPGKSHFSIYMPLFKALASKGHNLTVVSYFPREKTIPNYRDVFLGDSCLEKSSEFLSIELFRQQRFRWISGLFFLNKYMDSSCSRGYKSENFHKFLKEDNKFDLILVQFFVSECFTGLIKQLDVPTIGNVFQKRNVCFYFAVPYLIK